MTISQALAKLSQLPGNRLSRSKKELALHRVHKTRFPACLADAADRPSSIKKAGKIVTIAARQGCPVAHRSDGALPEENLRPIVNRPFIDFARMSSIAAPHAEDKSAAAQPDIPMILVEFREPAASIALNVRAQPESPERRHLLVAFRETAEGLARYPLNSDEIVAERDDQDRHRAIRREEHTGISNMRHSVCFALKPGAKAISTDVCTPIFGMLEAVEETRKRTRAEGSFATRSKKRTCARSSVGLNDAAELTKAEPCTIRMGECQICGTVIRGRGNDIGKLKYKMTEHEDGWNVMGTIRTALDAQYRMKSEKLVWQ